MSALPSRAAHAAPRERAAHLVARHAVGSLWAELALDPKPGLVSLRDAGAHDDMDAATFVRSLFALRRHFQALAAAGYDGAPFDALRQLGREAETAMLAATGGVNTHRGAIFALGLLGAAAGRAQSAGVPPRDATLRRIVRAHWGEALAAHARVAEPRSHGEHAARRYGVHGARGEAQRAFPAVFEIALPALRAARGRGCDARHARLSALFALLCDVDDTNVLHRAGRDGIAFVRASARAFRAAGDVHAPGALRRAAALHRAFVRRRVSPGGCADLLAAAIFVDALQAAP